MFNFYFPSSTLVWVWRILIVVAALPFLVHSHDANAHPAVFIKLNVQEALPNQPGSKTFKQIKGVDRVKEPVTLGLPLHNDSNLLLIEQLLLVGTNDFQYTILKKWPNERIKWILVDMLADVKANEVNESMFLTAGTGIVPPIKLAKEQGDSIVIDTKAATFTLRKKGFNLFDAVKVGSTELVKTGNASSIELIGEDGTVYRSTNDQDSVAEISHNGPIRSMVTAKGWLKSEKNTNLLAYAARLHFYKGKTRVRVEFTLRNASKTLVEHVKFKSLELVQRTTLQTPSYVFSNHDGESQGGPLSSSAAASLFQGQNSFPTIQGKGYDAKVWPTGIEGYKIVADGKDIKTGTKDQPISLFYAQATNTDKAVTVGTRFAAGHWPQALSVNGDGALRVGLYPKGNDKPYIIRYNSHRTHEVVFYFSSKVESPRDEVFRFQYPLFARPQDVDWFNQVEIWNSRYVSYKEESDYSKAKKWPTDSHPLATDNRVPTFAVVRHVDASGTRKPEAYSVAMAAFSNALRQPNLAGGAYYLMAQQWVRYFGDLAVHHSDDYDAAKSLDEVPALKDSSGNLKSMSSLANADLLPSTPSLWTLDYASPVLLNRWFYVFGDYRMRGALEQWGEYLLFLKAEPSTSRQVGQWLLRLSTLFEFTNNTAFQKKAWSIVEDYIVKPEAKKGESAGQDKRRGFFIGTQQAKESNRILHMGATAGSLLRGAMLFESAGASDEPQSAAIRDLIDGVSRHIADELFVNYSETLGEYGFPFTVSLDEPIGDLRGKPGWTKGLEEAHLAVANAFLMSNDEKYLQLGEQLLGLTAFNPSQIKGFGDLPSRQFLQYMVENPLLFPTWRELPLQAKKLDDGRYRLTWIAPYNPTNFWFKMSEKPIVATLGYDPNQQAFDKNPEQFTPFFAATYIKEIPKIVDPGLYQAMFVKVPDPSKDYYFAARFLSTDPRKPPREPFGEPSSENVTGQDGGEGASLSDDVPVEKIGGAENRVEQPETLTPPPVCGCEQSNSVGWLFPIWCLVFLILIRRRFA